MRDWRHTYTWYDRNPKTNGGHPGGRNGGTCVSARCDTAGYVEAVNRVGLCGWHDWRMPTLDELRSIVDKRRENPAIDTDWFPNTPSMGWWSASSDASDSARAYAVYFGNGNGNGNGLWFDRTNARPVRLVRAGQ